MYPPTRREAEISKLLLASNAGFTITWQVVLVGSSIQAFVCLVSTSRCGGLRITH